MCNVESVGRLSLTLVALVSVLLFYAKETAKDLKVIQGR